MTGGCLTFQVSSWDDFALLLCPLCDCPNVHIDAVEMFGSAGQCTRLEAPPEDSGDRAAIIDREIPAKRWPTRRHSVVLVGWCESNHHFEIAFVQHKGDTEMYIQSVPTPA